MNNFVRKTRAGLISSGGMFVIAQAIVLPLAIGLPIVRSWSIPRGPQLPAFQNQPLLIAPQYDDPRVITDEQLAMVLRKLQPRFGQQPKINHVDHALRFWGTEARFDSPECLSGQQMRQLLLDNPTFVSAWGEKTPPLLVSDKNGIAVRTQEGTATASHVDHTLASLAEVGTPLDYPVDTPAGPATMEALLRQALLDFSVNQVEYEWTALALALYAPGSQPWYSKEGQQITFDLLTDRILRQDYGQGVCFGNHRLYTLTVLLRVDDAHQILSPAARQRINEHLTDATRRLIATQSAEGWWDRSWPGGKTIEGDQRTDGEKLAQRLLATGHALEWWAMAPHELHPTREALARAGQWLVKEIENMDDAVVQENYTYLSHVGRALALWRGDMPAALVQRLGVITHTQVSQKEKAE